MGWRITLWVTLVVVALAFLYLVRGILLPFIVSFIIAALLEPSVRRLRLRGFSRGAAVSVVFALFFMLLTGIAILAGPTVVRQIGTATQAFRSFTNDIASASEADNYFLRWNPVNQALASTKQDQLDVLLTQAESYLQRLGLVKIVDEAVPQRGRAQLTHGEVVAALIANRLSAPAPDLPPRGTSRFAGLSSRGDRI